MKRAQFDCMVPEQEELAIKFCMEIAGKRGEKGSLPDPVRLLEMAEALYAAEMRGAEPLSKESLLGRPTPPSDESPVGEISVHDIIADNLILAEWLGETCNRFEDFLNDVGNSAHSYQRERIEEARAVLKRLDYETKRAPTPQPERVTVDALDALVIHADAYLVGECSKAEFSEATERARAALSISSEGEGG